VRRKQHIVKRRQHIGRRKQHIGRRKQQPAYCSAIGDLKSAIKSFPTTSILKKGTSALESSLSRVQHDANALVADVKSDFAGETNALKSSLDALSITVKHVASSPNAATIGQLPAKVAAVGTAVKNVAGATAPKCG
jgi:hypothetical protein